MKKVIMIPGPNQEETKKQVEFTEYLDINRGWLRSEFCPKEYKKVVYLGRCSSDGDMFAAYTDDNIYIYKGRLNSGEY